MQTKYSVSVYRILCWTSPLMIVIASFGPYLFTYFRTEQIIIYGYSFLLSLSLVWISIAENKDNILIRLPTTLFIVILSIVLITVWTLFSTIYNGEYTSLLRVIAGIENYLQPIAVISILAIASMSSWWSSKKQLHSILMCLLILLGLNTIVSLGMVITNMEPVAKYFVVGPHSTGIHDTVWWRAKTNGRYSGIFNQPYEAGVMYSLGMFGFAYLSRSEFYLKFHHYILGLFVFIGGFLPVTKVYFLIGLPLFLMFLIEEYRIQILHSAKTLVIGVSALVSIGILVTIWEGGTRLLRYIPSRSTGVMELITLYSAGRFTTGSYIYNLTVTTFREAFITGFGFGTISPFDSGYLEFFSQGGIVALFLYLFILLLIFKQGMSSINCLEGKMITLICIFTVGLSLGMPVITVNRASPVFWTIVSILILVTIEDHQNVSNKALTERSETAP